MNTPTTHVTEPELVTKQVIALPTTPPNAELAELYESPYKYSGIPVESLEGSTEQQVGSRTINIFKKDDGKEYVAVDERLIPYKDWSQSSDKTLSEAVGRYNTYFQNSAESGICPKCTPAEIEYLRNLYKEEAIDRFHKRPLAAIIMGATMERLNQLAPILEEESKKLATQGFSRNEISDKLQQTDAYKEVSQHMMFLYAHEEKALATAVHTRTDATDHDKRFLEFMHEATKAFALLDPKSAVEINYNHATKISSAMKGIESIGETMHELVQELPPSSHQYANFRDGTSDVIQQFIATARMRVGINSTDNPAYSMATVQYKAAKDALSEIYKNSRDITETESKHVHSQSKAARAVEQLSKGIDLIDDISRMRNDLPIRRTRFKEKAEHLLSQNGHSKNNGNGEIER